MPLEAVDEVAVSTELAGVPEAEPNPEVHISKEASDPAVIESGGVQIAMSIPAEGTGVPLSGETVVFEGSTDGNSIFLESTSEGVRALINIETELAPERYDFEFGADVAGLELNDDGSVELLAATGESVGFVPVPYALCLGRLTLTVVKCLPGLKYLALS